MTKKQQTRHESDNFLAARSLVCEIEKILGKEELSMTQAYWAIESCSKNPWQPCVPGLQRNGQQGYRTEKLVNFFIGICQNEACNNME